MSSTVRSKWLWLLAVSASLASWSAPGTSSAQGASPPPRLVIVTFDDQGVMLRPDLFNQQLQNINPTHVFVAAHGWWTTQSDAVADYQRMIASLSSVADSFNTRPPNYMPLVVGVHWPSTIVDNPGSSNRSVGTDPDQTLLSIYRAFPTYKSPQTYSQDVLTMQRLLQLSPDQATPDDAKTAAALFKKYSIRSSTPDDIDLLLDPLDNDRAIGLSFLNVFNVFTYWQMKERAGITGEQGVRPMVSDLQQRFPQASFHLSGHSFGCKVMLATVASDTALSRPADSLVLLQGAVSYQAMDTRVADTGLPGGYIRALDKNRGVRGVIAATFSLNDSALNLPYEMASRVAGQVGELDRSVSQYSALGRVGAADVPWVAMRPPGTPYNFTRSLWSINGTSFIPGHSVIYGPEVAWMIWSATNASTAQAGNAPGENRSISEDKFVDLSSTARGSAQAVADKVKPTNAGTEDVSSAAFVRSYFETLRTLARVAPSRVDASDNSPLRAVERDLSLSKGLQSTINDKLLDYKPFADNFKKWIASGQYEKDAIRGGADRIVGGGIRTAGFTYTVAVGTRIRSAGAQVSYLGSGIHFRQGFVLTAAHVIPRYFDPSTDEMAVSFKSDVNVAGAPDPISAVKVYVHENYDYATKQNDIALLYLGNITQPIDAEFGGFASDSDFVTTANPTILTIVGYGTTDPRIFTVFDGHRQYARIPLVPLPYTTDFDQQYNIHPTYEFAAADPQNGIDTCFGDSGGPILASAAGKFRLAGLTSRGLQQGCGQGGCYVRPDKFQAWIDGKIQDATSGTAPVPTAGSGAPAAPPAPNNAGHK
jgi:Trypsin